MNVICPSCTSETATMRLDLSDGDTVTCDGCDGEFSATTIRKVVDGWLKILPWIEAHPARTPEPPVTT